MAGKSSPTLLQTDDGGMYFIPGEQLEQYRVPDDQAKDVEEKLKAAENPEVAGFSFETALSPASLGFDNPSAPTMDDSPTQVGSVRQYRTY